MAEIDKTYYMRFLFALPETTKLTAKSQYPEYRLNQINMRIYEK
jgi:hypothetical protein